MHRTLLVLTLIGIFVAQPGAAQSSCASEPLCPDGRTQAGEFPQCRCDGDAPSEPPFEPEPPAPEPPLPEPGPEPDEGPPVAPTCAASFACPDPQQTAFGQFPECTCATLDTPLPPGAPTVPDPGIPPGMGFEADTCKAFFCCPAGFDMTVRDGRCACQVQMLPPEEEQAGHGACEGGG